MKPISRRRLITTGAAATAGVAGLAVAGHVAKGYGLVPPTCKGGLGAGDALTYAAQRVLTAHSLAREFSRDMISKAPFANEIAPPTDEFKRKQASGFVDWRLSVEGLVAHPGLYSISELKGLPAKSQITEIACEEGWSYIAEWIGTPLYEVLNAVGVLPQARYVAFFSIEKDWWDSIDMADAMHPQTLLAWGMNDGDLPVPFGGPLRMRVPRQLGYKNVKFINRILVTDSVKTLGSGAGAPGVDYGYSWYAGI